MHFSHWYSAELLVAKLRKNITKITNLLQLFPEKERVNAFREQLMRRAFSSRGTRTCTLQSFPLDDDKWVGVDVGVVVREVVNHRASVGWWG